MGFWSEFGKLFGASLVRIFASKFRVLERVWLGFFGANLVGTFAPKFGVLEQMIFPQHQ